jgi:hypothetical protein
VIAEVIVLGSIALAVAFALGWIASPDLRTRIEEPKHRFLAGIRQYDRNGSLSEGDGRD